MNRHSLLACSIAAAALLSASVAAQTVIVVPVVPVQAATAALPGAAASAQVGASAQANPMAPEIKVHQSSSGVSYLSGGASTDVREAMDKRRSEFPLKVSVSACSGQYLVADQLTLSGPKGEFLSATDVGPIVMTKPPASGKVTAKVTYQGETKSRSFDGKTSKTVNICFKTAT